MNAQPHRLGKADWVLGAIWRYAKQHRIARPDLVRLLACRAKLGGERADQLASHWLRSSSFIDQG